MAGFGTMMHALISMKTNKRERKSQLKRYQRLTGSAPSKKFSYGEISDEDLLLLREKLQKEQKAIIRKRNIYFSIICVVITGLVIAFLFFPPFFSFIKNMF